MLISMLTTFKDATGNWCAQGDSLLVKEVGKFGDGGFFEVSKLGKSTAKLRIVGDEYEVFTRQSQELSRAMLSSMTVNQLGEINRLVSSLRDRMLESGEHVERVIPTISIAHVITPPASYQK